MSSKTIHNKKPNRIKALFFAPYLLFRAILRCKVIPQAATVMLLTVMIIYVSAQTVESQRSFPINFGTQQVINIFPSEVITDEWAVLDHVLVQDLSEHALYQDFSARNSSYVPQKTLLTPVENTDPVSTDSSTSKEVIPSPDVKQPPQESTTEDPISVNEEMSSSPTSTVDSDDTSNEPPLAPAGVNENTEATITEPVADDKAVDEGVAETSNTSSTAGTEDKVQPEPVNEAESATEEGFESTTEPTPEVSIIQSARDYVYGVFSNSISFFPLAQYTTSTPVSSEPVTDSEAGARVDSESSLKEELVDEEIAPTEEVVPVLPVEDVLVQTATGAATTSAPSDKSEVLSEAAVAESTEETTENAGQSPVDTVLPEAEKQTVHEITLSDFTTAPLEPGQFIDSMQLRLSFAAQLEPSASGAAPYVEVLFGEKDKLSSVGAIIIDGEVSNAINGGYFLFTLPGQSDIGALASSSVVLRYHGDADLLDGMFLDAAWIEVNTRLVTEEDLKKRGVAERLKHLQAPAKNVLVSDTLNFARDERPLFNLRYTPQRNALVRGLRDFVGRDVVSVKSAQVIHRSSGLVNITPEVVVTKEGLITIELPENQLNQLKPGTYEIELVLEEGGAEYTDSFDFQWGVLSMNPNKSEYEMGETAQISLGALTPNGHTLCEANLQLYVIDPDGFITKSPVTESGLCDGNNIIDVPDYTAEVLTTTTGTYDLYLERLDDNGEILGFTRDTFLVTADQDLSIERDGPTRIYPPSPYPMSLTIEAKDGFTGTLTERVPASFAVSSTSADISVDGDWQILEWDISIPAGGAQTLSYGFDAPDLSPYLFNLGPAFLTGASNQSMTLTATSGEGIITQPEPQTNSQAFFTEHRQWQIASDAVGNMILFWTGGATPPAGWTCLSCGSGTFFQRFVMGGATYNTVGGAATHGHSVTSSLLSSSETSTEGGGGGPAIVTHTHTFSPTIAAVSNLPEYRELRVIQYTAAAGEPAIIPAGAVGIFDVPEASLPADWARYTAQDGRYIRGENTVGTTGGTNTHTHDITGTTGAATGGTARSRGGGTQVDGATADHTHPLNTSTGVQSNEPPFITAVLAEVTTDTAPPNGLIAMWTEEVDGGWIDVSSAGGDPFNGRFIKPSDTYGVTGGGTSHAHADISNVLTSLPSAVITGRVGTAGAGGTHTHAVNFTNFSTQDHLPPYLTAVFGKRQGTNPVYNQTSSRWFVNEDSQTPTDAWPVGLVDLSEKASITTQSVPVKVGDELRLRMNVRVTNATSTIGSSFKLQYAAADTCSAAVGWADVGAASSGAIWRGYENPSVADNSTLSTTVLSSSTVAETYEENGFATSSPNNITVDGYGEWDFVLQQNGAAAGTNYCFRMVEADGATFSTYSHYPQLLTNRAPNPTKLEEPFDNERVALLSPEFDFESVDPEGERIHYEIEIDTDYTFATPVVSRDTINDAALFENQTQISDKAPFVSGKTIEFFPDTSLTDGVTYYWRVRGQDPDGSTQWGDWSVIRSFTVDTTLDAAAWFQTQDEQFDTNVLSGVETGGGEVTLITGSTTGTMVTQPINFNDGELGTAWDSFVFSDTETVGDITYQIEYLDNTDTWTIVPDTDLPGNSVGFDTSPVSLLALDVEKYNLLRIKADFTDVGGSPSLQDWGLYWGYRVGTPTILALFANEQLANQTPTFIFNTTDPQNDSLTYQVEWSTDNTFATATTRTSDTDAGFLNHDTGADTDPFNSGDKISFTVQAADALTDNTTYWWRVRAKDTTGDNTYSFWTDPRSFTIIPGTEVSTWFQTTQEQFASNILSGTEPLVSDAVSVSTQASEAMLVYGEGIETVPKYRQWNGTQWSNQADMLDVGGPVMWSVVRAGTTREEYVAATLSSDNDINLQVFTVGAWRDLLEVTTTVTNVNARGFDIAYETNSGDAVVVYCDGDADPSYRIWNGTTWSAASTIVTASADNCAWIDIASDPTSDEMIVMVRSVTGAQYEGFVWNGTTWGNATSFGSTRDASFSGQSVAYEASGGQAVAVAPSPGGGPNRMVYNVWDGTAWSGETTLTIAGRLYWAGLSPNVGNDDMVMCYINDNANVQTIRWDGAGWVGDTQLAATVNAVNDPAYACIYETATGRTNDILATYADVDSTDFRTYNGAWSAGVQVGMIGESATMQLTRTGTGDILGSFFDHTNDRLLFSNWTGTWSPTQTLENNMPVDGSPYGQPYFMAPRNPGSEGVTIVSPPIDFTEGTGPYWDDFSWTETKPGTSAIVYHMQYETTPGNWEFIPDADLPGNETGFTTGPVDLSALNINTYERIRPYATLSCDGGGNCPTIEDWQVQWAGGITISGTLQEYDQLTNVSTGTIAVAVNGSMQVGKTGTVSAGTWSIDNVTAFAGDVITVFVTGAADANEAVGVARYDGLGNMSGLNLFERHLSLGSDDVNTTAFTNADLGLYHTAHTEDVFHAVIGTTLTVCADVGCDDAKLFIKAGTQYTPGGQVITHDLVNNGTFTAGNFTHQVSGSWDNNATTTMTGSTVVFAATAGTESIDSTGAITSSFNNITFGTTTGNGTWSLLTPLDINGALTVTRGTLARGTVPITVAGNLLTQADGFWTGTGTTTFDGATAATWGDQNTTVQNVGQVVVDGASKVLTLTESVAADSVTIEANDTLDATNGNHSITVFGNWTNKNNFLPRAGTVIFAATDAGNTITTAGDAFYDVTFNGTGGDWSFTEPTLTVNNDFTASAGAVVMPTATTTIGGSFDTTGGTFANNNGVLRFNSATAQTITFAGGPFSNVAATLLFDGGGSWVMSDTNATATAAVIVEQGSVTFPNGVLAIGGTLQDIGGSFTGGSGTVRFYSSVSQSITAGGSSFDSVAFAGAGDWSFTDAVVDINGDLDVLQGTVTLPNDQLTIGGSYFNTATVNAGTGLVTFDAPDTANTVDFGSSALYDVQFASEAGGWTVTAPATTTNNFTLASSSDWTLATGQTLSVGGVFINTIGGASTTWAGSTLSLETGDYAVNTKLDAGDSYGTLRIAGAADIALWNSVATTYEVAPTGSLYSQDHNAVDGDLYIWGQYEKSAGAEFWNYATDFDGTDLTGGAERAASVRFAADASATFASSTFEVVGEGTATTTVSNQGSGTYTIAVSAGTTTAQYYAFADLGSTGVSLLDATVVPTLRDGSYVVGASGGSALTLSSTTIDISPGKQIFNVSFATTTAITATNVTQSDGVPSSFWWFREGTGNLYGENFDTDTGDPGSVRFDDSSLSITVAGTVYSDAGVTPLVGGTCDGITPTVRLLVNGDTAYTTSCSAADGSFSVSGVTVIGDPTLTLYLDNAAGGEQASLITRTPTGDILDADLYANRVIVRNEDTEAITTQNLAIYDNNDDGDLQFVAATGTSADTLTVLPGNELYVAASSTFTPNGPVTIAANAAGTSYDGTLYLADGATFTGAGTTTYTIGGRLVLGTGAVFVPASSTVLMNATTTGKSITAVGEITFYDLVFNGVGGGWNIGADMLLTGDMAVTQGVVTGTGDISLLNGSITGDGVLSLGAGTTTLASTNTLGGNSAWTFYNLQLGDTLSVGTTTPIFTNPTTVAGQLTIATAHYLDAGTTSWNLSGSGTVLVENGTFLADTSTMRYSGAGANVLATEYYNLVINAAAGSQTYIATGLGTIVNNDLTIGGAADTVLDINTTNPAFDVNGDVLVASNGTLSLSDTSDFTIAGNYENNGTLTANNGTVTFDGAGTTSIAAGASSFGSVLIAATGNVTVTEHATATNWTLQAADTFTVSSGQSLAVGGSFFTEVTDAVTTWTDATLRLFGGNNYSLNASTTNDTYGTLSVVDTTQVRLWGSSAAIYDVASTASVYSQDHAGVIGDLYIWGDYINTDGADYWSYATDFDGTALGGGARKVDVYFDDGASASILGGSLTVTGIDTASTTLQTQASGTYGVLIGGNSTASLEHYQVRDIDSAGMVFSGSPVIGTLSNGDIEVSQEGGSAMTVGGSVITANPAKTFSFNRFALAGVSSGFNVTATGTALSSWRFTNHSGDIAGEANDSDPDGDPGYIVWDDSAANITISGVVYTDQGVTPAGGSVCDGVTNTVRIVVAGFTTYETTCTSGTGAFSVSGVSYSPGDSAIAYLLPASGVQGATVTVGPVSNINNFAIYQDRTIMRHENTDPITIADLAVYDSSDDANIPFTAVTAGTDTLTLPTDTKLIVWNGKEFKPNGDVTLTAGGSASYGGSLELFANAMWTAQGTEALSIGGNLIADTDAVFTAANGTVTFTTTGAGRTINTNENAFANINFTGSGSWALTDPTLTVEGDYTKSAGSLTFPTGTSTFAGSFVNTGGTFAVNGSNARFTGTGAHTVTLGGSDLTSAVFLGGSYTFGDTNATATESVLIESGSVTLPSGRFTIGGDFLNTAGAFSHNSGELYFTQAATSSVQTAGSDLYGVTFAGGGEYTFVDENLALLDSLLIGNGAVTLASGTMSIGGSFDAAGGTFSHASGTLLFNSADVGEYIDAGVSDFNNVQISAPTGGYSLLSNATTTNNFSLAAASSFTAQSGTVLTVNGVFLNSVPVANTSWTGSTLILDGQNSYTVNTKTSGANYDTLIIGENSDIRLWNSAATSTAVAQSSSLYSQDNAARDGELAIYGDFHVSTTTEYWSYATDFDGADLSGFERAVTVQIAGGATTTLDGGTLQMLGAAGNKTVVTTQGSGQYALAVSAGTLNASYYTLRNMDSAGLNISGTPTIASLAFGDYELAVDGGSLLSLTAEALTANASLVIPGATFSTSTPVTGFNVNLSGSTASAWTFTGHTGNLDGEAYDNDGLTECGSIRWNDSSCQLTQQTDYRWRTDDGGIGVPNTEWYNATWDARQSLRIHNTDAVTYTDAAVRVVVPYDTDMQADFADLRFTAADGVTLVPHWVGSTTNNGVAEVWLKLASLSGETTQTVYMYYNNPLATTTSSSTQVFTASDDFEDGDISEYSGQTGLFTVDGTFAFDGANGLDNTGEETGRANLGGIYRTDQEVGVGDTFRYLQYVDTGDGASDETCTLFGVQSPGSNYAVCFRLIGADRISLVEDAVDNDSTAPATVLASQNVTFTTGWYEVEVEWAAGELFLSVYNPAGDLFATTSATTTTYSSGGIGFTYWFNHGGWDSVSARPTLTTEPTYVFGAEQVDGGASWKAPVNTLGIYNVNDVARVRFAVENSGLAIGNQQFLLEYAPLDAAPSCEAVNPTNYAAVPTQSSCGTSPVCMQSSTFITDGAPTADLLSRNAGTYALGEVREDPSNSTGNINIGQNQYTELEYAVTPTINVADENLCFRVTNNGAEYDTYLQVAQLQLRFDPVVTNAALNGGSDISLVPGTTTPVLASATVTDLNGFADITLASSTIYRSGVAGGALCTPDNNNCYTAASSSCSFASCAGNSCEVQCRVDMFFHADATDSGSPFEGQEWLALIETEDAAGGYGFGSTAMPGVEVFTLRAIDVQGAIDYGTLSINSDTGSYNASTSVLNQGNVAINLEVAGTDLSDGLNSAIPAEQQKFATSTFTYSGCIGCQLLSSSTPVQIDVDLSKPAVDTPPVADDVFWGIAVPFGVNSVPHSGINVFTPVSP